MIPPKPGSGLHRVWADHAAKFPDTLSKSPVSYDFWEGKESGGQEEDMGRKRAWRISTEQVETLRTLAKKYEGTHNFHNFTVSRDFADRSNNRFMKKIEVSYFGLRLGYFRSFTCLGCRSYSLWRYRMDQCPFPWTEFYATSSGYLSSNAWVLGVNRISQIVRQRSWKFDHF